MKCGDQMNCCLSERIAQLRKERGLTQEQLGQLVGVSAQAVSKWEKGGAPDVELLPALADRLGVTIDGLFGRSEDAPQDIGQLFIQWLQSIPRYQRMGQLFQLLATNLLGLYMEDQYLNSDEGKTVAKTCYLHDFPDDDLVWLRSNFTTDEGMLLGVAAENFPMYLLLPEPPEGYEAHFAPIEDYRKLFAILSQEGCLELLLFLYRKKFSYYIPAALAKQAGLPLEQVEGLLPGLVDCQLLRERSLELEDGPAKVYCVHDNHGLVPFLYFARWFMEKSDGWNYGWDVRERPILELTEEQIQRKKEHEHETKH